VEVAPRDGSNLYSIYRLDANSKTLKRRRLDTTALTMVKVSSDGQRDNSRRYEFGDMTIPQFHFARASPDLWDRDPYQIDPKATARFLELFFAHSAPEVSMMFPQITFARWVEHESAKDHQECDVLFAVLTLGSTYAEHEFPSFAKLCAEKVRQRCSSIDGDFSIIMIQTRLLIASYHHLRGEDSLGWSLSGSALQMINIMRLNHEAGCSESLSSSSRPHYNFKCEQWIECRRRTFWAAFLVDVGTRETVFSILTELTQDSCILGSIWDFPVLYR
jgi:hypothetical protein